MDKVLTHAFGSLSGIMSTVMSQQLPKEDEEEEDEEQGEEFVFEDSDDEEKLREGSGGVGSHPVPLTKREGSETAESVSQTGAAGVQSHRRSPPAGQEGTGTVFTEGNAFF